MAPKRTVVAVASATLVAGLLAGCSAASGLPVAPIPEVVPAWPQPGGDSFCDDVPDVETITSIVGLGELTLGNDFSGDEVSQCFWRIDDNALTSTTMRTEIAFYAYWDADFDEFLQGTSDQGFDVQPSSVIEGAYEAHAGYHNAADMLISAGGHVYTVGVSPLADYELTEEQAYVIATALLAEWGR